MPRALITGATGFVGMSLSKMLISAGWHVTAAQRSSSSSPRLETLRSWGASEVRFARYEELPSLAAGSRPDVVFHLAAHQAMTTGADEVGAFIDANISLGAHLLEGLSGTGTVFVSALSYFQFRENSPTSHSLYSATKQAFTEISAYYRDRRGVDIRDVVLYDNFGPDDTRNKLVIQLIRAIATDASITVGPLDQPINVLHVEDVASGLIAASSPGNPEMMTVKSEADATVGEIVAAVERAAQRASRASIDTSRTVSDLTVAAGTWPTPVGWAPRWTLDNGISETYRAFVG